jgi:hypothetical protein
MRLLIPTFALFALVGCMHDAPPPTAPLAPQPEAPPAQPMPPGTLTAAPPPEGPWGALAALPGIVLPAAQQLPLPLPTQPQPPPAQPAPAQPPPPQSAPPFGIPPWPLPAAWPMPASLPAIPGVPAWPGTTPPAPAQPGPTPPVATGDVAQRCVDDINRYRATKSLPPLARWADGEPCATSQAADDSRSQRPHGTFGRCKERAQNACPNWSGPAEKMTDDCLQMMWNEGPGEFPAHGHYNNMVDTRSTKVACGTFTMPDGRLWAVQDFQ